MASRIHRALSALCFLSVWFLNPCVLQATTLPDADGDGMDDAFEVANDLNASDASDAVLDMDGDGVHNLDEYLAGTLISDTTSTPFFVIRDNTDPEFSFTGFWYLSTSSSGYWGANNHLHDGNPGTTAITEVATWQVALPVDDTYKVYARWRTNSNNAGAAKYTLKHNNVYGKPALTHVVVDQSSNGGQWVLLGSFAFNSGTTIVRLSGQDEDQVVADAVRFVGLNQGALPTPIDADEDGLADAWEAEQGISDPTDDSDGDGLTALQEYLAGTNPHLNDTDNDTRVDGYEVANGLDALDGDDLYFDADQDGVSDIDEAAAGTNPVDALSTPLMQILDDESSAFTAIGYWVPYSGYSGFYGMEYHKHLNANTNDGEYVQWQYYLEEPGHYRVYARWSVSSSLASDATYTIHHINADGTAASSAVSVNQANTGAEWVLLGAFDLAAGISQIILSEAGDGYIIADSIKLLQVPGIQSPIAAGVDSDGDGMSDDWELVHGLNPQDSADALLDTDADGLTNAEEFSARTDPNVPDTDGDILNDDYEIANNLNPNDRNDALLDADGDGVSNLDEYYAGTNLHDAANAPFTSVVDNTDAGFSAQGPWYTSNYKKGYWGSNYHTHVISPGAAGRSSVVTWQFNLPADDQYRIYAYWPEYHNFAHDAEFTIHHLNEYGQPAVTVIKADQRINSGQWFALGNFNFKTDTISLSLGAKGSGNVIADAIRVLSLNKGAVALPVDDNGDGIADQWASAFGVSNSSEDSDGDGLTAIEEYQAGTNPGSSDSDLDGRSDLYEINNNLDPLYADDVYFDTDGDAVIDIDELFAGADPLDANNTPQLIIIDNEGADFSYQGNWKMSSSDPGYYGSYSHYHYSGGSGLEPAQWQINLDAQASYNIYARWPMRSYSAKNAEYTVNHLDASDQPVATTIVVDQHINGGDWVLLGNFTLPTGTSMISLADIGNGKMYADAIKVLRIDKGNNNPPQIHSTPITDIAAGQVYQYDVDATDMDGDTLRYTLIESPPGTPFGIDSQSGLISWSTGVDSVGTYPITVKVEDDRGASATQSYTLTVSGSTNNNDPVITSTPLMTGQENQLYQYAVVATDADGDVLSYALTQAPGGMTIDGQTGLLNWLPDFDSAGEHSVGVLVSDGQGGNATQLYQLFVGNINQVPQAHNQNLSTQEDNLLAIVLTGNDGDGDPLSYAIESSPSNGTLIGTAPHLSYQPGANFNGSDLFSFTVNDGTADSTTAQITITVTAQNDAPQITSTPITTATEGAPYSYTVSATDIDGDSLGFALTSSPSGMSIDALSGVINWTPDYVQAGNHAISVAVTDGQGGSGTQSFSIDVSDTNVAPTIISYAMTTAVENQAYSYPVLAEDPDGDALTYSLVVSPSGMSMDTSSGLISWTPDYSQAGSHDVTLRVADINGALVQQSFVITVQNANRAPVITSTPLTTVQENQAYSYTVNATDDDGDNLTFALNQAPSGMTIDTESGLLVWQPAGSDVGVHSIEITVSDGNGGEAVQMYSLTVTGVPNQPPVISSSPTLVGVEGSAYQYPVLVNDPDGDAVTLQITQGPAGLVVDGATQTLTWDNPLVGSYPVTIVVTDSEGLQDTQSYQLQVVEEQPPLTTQGSDFWLMFNMQAAAEPNLLLYVSTTVETNVVVDAPGFGYQSTQVVSGNAVLTVDLTNYVVANTLNELGIRDYSVHVSADNPVSLYLMNARAATSDASLVLPSYVLGKSYRVMSYAGKLSDDTGLNFGNYIGVVATEDNTVVTINPRVRVHDAPQNLSEREAGVPYEIVLNRGETYQASAWGGPTGSGGLELTGTVVSADKPIALFTGDQCAAVQDLHCDHLVEQMPPVNSWGTRYLTMSLATRTLGDTFRILADRDDTYVWVNGDVAAYLNAGEFYQAIIDGPSLITTSRPVLVAQFSNGNLYDSTGAMADPFMVIVPPTEQYLSAYNITTPADGFRFNFLNLIAPAWSTSSILLDGNPINSSSWVDTPDPYFKGAQLPVGAGQHTLSGDENFGFTVYGFDEYNSYGYVGGMALSEARAVTNLQLSTNNPAPISGEELCISAQLFDDTQVPVAQQQVHFTREVAGLSLVDARLTDVTGIARFCYTGSAEGDEQIAVSMQALNQPLTINWQPYNGSENLAPQILTRPVMFANPRAAYSYQVVVQDPDQDALSFTLAEGPADMSIDPVTGLVAWTPSGSFEEVWVTLQVSDGQLQTIQRYRLTSPPGANHYPDFTSEPETRVMTGRTYSYVMQASDVEGDLLIFNKLVGPDDMTVNGNTLSWAVDELDVGPHFVTIEVSDSEGFSSSQSFTLEVELNLPPQFTSEPIINAITGHDYISYYTAIDDNADRIIYSLITRPAGMTIQNTTSLYLRWTPGSDQVGEHQVVIQADDQFGGVTTQEFTVTVIPNQPPVFTSAPPTTAVTGHPYNYYYTRLDPDGDPFNYYPEIVYGPAGMNINSRLYWTPSAEQVGVHEVQLKIDDRHGGWATQTFSILVTANQAPQFTSTPITTAVSGHFYKYDLTGTDAEGDNIQYSVHSGPAGLSTVINRWVQWTPTPEQVGSHIVVIKASDQKGGETLQSYTLEVLPNSNPVFTSTPPKSVLVGGPRLDYRAAAVDAENDAVYYRLLSGPNGMTFSAGRALWTPTAAQEGTHSVSIEAYDNYGGSTTQSFDIIVVADGVRIIEYPDNPSIYHDELYSFSIDVLHPAASQISFQLSTASSGAAIDSSTGLFTWTPSASQIGTHSFMVTASDGNGHEDSVIFTIEVLANTNLPPEVNDEQSTFHVKTETLFSHQIQASDPEGQAITFELVTAPDGVALSPEGLLTWQATGNDIGEHLVDLNVIDARGASSAHQITLRVTSPGPWNRRICR